MPRTLRIRYVAGLEALGYAPVVSASRKYLAYRHPHHRASIYVGNAGALRVGATVTGSMALSDAFKRYVLTAPELRPQVYAELNTNPPPIGADTTIAESAAIAVHLLDKLNGDVVSIRLHVRQWLKARARS